MIFLHYLLVVLVIFFQISAVRGFSTIALRAAFAKDYRWLKKDSRRFLGQSSKIEIPSVPATTTEWIERDFWGNSRTVEEIAAHVTQAIQSIGNKDGMIPKVEVLHAEPPLVIIHNFLSPEMCRAIIDAAKDSETLQTSTIGANKQKSEKRTSSTTWLKEGKCEEPLRLLAEKVSRLSGMVPSNMESLQVVRYRPGQEFAIHTDHLDSFNDLEVRGRLATCLTYLQEPGKGGETRFFEFDVNVPPRLGSAVFFWNTIEKPGSNDYDAKMFLKADSRLRHAGLPVLEGEKWVCNRWIHPVEFSSAGVRGLEGNHLAEL